MNSWFTGAMVVLVAACGVYAAADTTEDTEAQATFKSIYGEEVARTMRTASVLDDVKLAGKLLEAAGASRNEPALLRLICNKAYDLGRKSSSGYDTALEAMEVLSANSAKDRPQCLEKAVVIQQLRYARSKPADRAVAAVVLLDAMMAACDANVEAGNLSSAKLQCMKASRLAISARLAQKDDVQNRYKELVAIERTNKLVSGYEKRLKIDPGHMATREALINILLVERDDPAAAAKWLNEDCDERLRMFIPMVAGDPSSIPEATLVELGDWYKSLAAGAQLHNKGGMLLRAKGFYEAFIARHAESDLAKTKAKLALARVQADIKKYGVKVPTKVETVVAAEYGGISRRALVNNPTKIPGVKAWTVEIREYSGEFKDVEFSRDSSQIITAGRDGAIRFWDAETGKFVRMLMGHAGEIRALEWSKDRKTLASGSADKTIRLWDVAAGKTTKTLRGSSQSISRLAWSPDGSGIASSGRESSVQIWSLRDGKLAGSIKAKDYIRGLDWGTASMLATGTDDGNVSLWNVRTGKPYGHFPLEQYKYKNRIRTRSVRGLAFSPINSKLLAVGFDNGTIKVWRAQTRIFTATMTPENKDSKGRSRIASPTCIEWAPGGRALAVGDYGSYGGFVWFWTPSGSMKFVVKDHAGSTVNNLAWSPDGKYVATAASDVTSSLIDAESGEVLRKIQSDRSRAAARPDFTANGVLMAYPCRDGTIRIWDLEKCMRVSVINMPTKSRYVTAVKWSPDASKIAFLAYGSGSVDVFDVKSGVLSTSLPDEYARLNGVAWSTDSKKIYTSQSARKKGAVGVIKVWDVATTGVDSTLSDKKLSSHYGLQASPDGKILASVGSDGKVNLWNLADKEVVRTIPADSRRVRCMTFSPDSKKLATCGDEKTVKVWSVESGQPIFGLNKHTSEVHQVAFSPDGTKLASVGQYSNLGVWDMTSGKEIAWFRTPNWKLHWLKDSKTLAAASGSGVYFYNASNGARKASCLHMAKNHGVMVSASGHYWGTPEVEKNLIYQTQTVSGQSTLSPEEFIEKYGWKNDPTKVRLIEAPAAGEASGVSPE